MDRSVEEERERDHLIIFFCYFSTSTVQNLRLRQTCTTVSSSQARSCSWTPRNKTGL